MDKALESGATVIGTEQVREAMRTLQKYKEGKKNLEARIIADEQWWKLRHWEQMRAQSAGGNPHDPQPSSGWLVNVVLNKHADAMDNYPEPVCLPREPGDEQEAEMLTRIVPVILEQADFKRAYRSAWWYKLKSGCGAYGVFWDTASAGGLGDITIRRMNLLNLFWEPGVEDIQRSANFFSVELVNNDALAAEFPQLAGKTAGDNLSVSKFYYDDTVDTTDKSLVVDWYYKRRVGGKDTLQYCKFCGDTVLYATENDPAMRERGWYSDGSYPFVFDALFPEEGTPCGYGYIDLCKSPQAQIDTINQAILKNAVVTATPRFFLRSDGNINEQEFSDWTRPFVHTNGNMGEDSVRAVPTQPLQGAVLNALTAKVDELRQISGNTEAATGVTGSSVTAASAIAALQEASGKLSRDMIDASYDAFRAVVLLVIERIRQFYDMPRRFRILGEYGEADYVSYTNEGLQPQPQDNAQLDDTLYRTPVIDIEVRAQRQSSYTRAEYNELALNLYGLGFFNPDYAPQALLAMSMMDFKGKEQLRRQIAQNGDMAQRMALMQSQMLQMAQVIDAQSGTQMAQQMAAQQQAQQPVPSGGSVSETGGGSVTDRARARAQAATEVR